jgi:hypothetical protein
MKSLAGSLALIGLSVAFATAAPVADISSFSSVSHTISADSDPSAFDSATGQPAPSRLVVHTAFNRPSSQSWSRDMGFTSDSVSAPSTSSFSSASATISQIHDLASALHLI